MFGWRVNTARALSISSELFSKCFGFIVFLPKCVMSTSCYPIPPPCHKLSHFYDPPPPRQSPIQARHHLWTRYCNCSVERTQISTTGIKERAVIDSVLCCRTALYLSFSSTGGLFEDAPQWSIKGLFKGRIFLCCYFSIRILYVLLELEERREVLIYWKVPSIKKITGNKREKLFYFFPDQFRYFIELVLSL